MTLNIGVFLGSRIGSEPSNINIVNEFSDWFSEQNYNLIFGGTETGLMMHLVKRIKNKKVRITSIFTKGLYENSQNQKYFTELIITDDSDSRDLMFAKKSDILIAFPGGIGTCTEVLKIINKNLLNEMNKKIFLINDTNFWNPLRNLLDHLVSKKFINKNLLHKSFKICKLEEFKSELLKTNAQN
ncbi:MAG: LOG family protein [Alphaproteobacteria bacterium]